MGWAKEGVRLNFLEVLPSNHTNSALKSQGCLQEIDGYSISNALALYYMMSYVLHQKHG